MKNLVASLSLQKRLTLRLTEKCVTELEKSQAKAEQYSRKNSSEISGIPHEILDNNLEDKVIKFIRVMVMPVMVNELKHCFLKVYSQPLF